MTGQTKKEGTPPAGTRVKDYFVSHKRQVAQMLLALLICGSMTLLQAFAAGSGASDAGSITSGVSSLESFVKKVVIGIGIVIALFGGVTLGLGFAQDNPDGQSRGVKFLIGGIVIASVGAFIKMFGGSV